jgi:hypothetical protein
MRDLVLLVLYVDRSESVTITSRHARRITHPRSAFPFLIRGPLLPDPARSESRNDRLLDFLFDLVTPLVLVDRGRSHRRLSRQSALDCRSEKVSTEKPTGRLLPVSTG